MIKKYVKLLFVSLSAFFIGVFSVNAAELTLEEMAETVKKIEPNATYLYVIGEYAFTSHHELTTQDIMLAARSIKVSENSGETNKEQIYNEMSIVYLRGTFDNNYNLNGFEFVESIVGTAKAKESYNIRYIDYVEIEEVEVNVETLVNNAYTTIEKASSNEKFAVAQEDGEIKVTVLDEEMNSVNALTKTGIASAATKLLETESVKSVTVAIPNTENSVELSITNLKDKLLDLDNLFKTLAGSDTATTGDLAGKSIDITINLKPGYTTEDEQTFTVSFLNAEEADVETLVNNAYTTIEKASSNEKFAVAQEDGEIKVTVLDEEMNSVNALTKTGIASAATKLLETESVKSVTVAIPNTENSVELSITNLKDKLLDLDNLFKTLAGSDTATAGDLAGKSIDITINLKPGYTTEDEQTFTVSFLNAEEADVETLVNNAYTTIEKVSSNEKFAVAQEDGEIKVTVLDEEMNSVNALTKTGIASAATKLLETESVKSVTVAIPNTENSVELSITNLKDKLLDLDNLFKTLAGSDTATAGDLAGKSIDITINLKPGYTTEDEQTFTVSFKK